MKKLMSMLIVAALISNSVSAVSMPEPLKKAGALAAKHAKTIAGLAAFGAAIAAATWKYAAYKQRSKAEEIFYNAHEKGSEQGYKEGCKEEDSG